MNDGFGHNYLIQALDPARTGSQPGNKNLLLADKVQISSIFRHLVVDTPEKTLEAARDKQDPADQLLPAQAKLVTNDRENSERSQEVSPVSSRETNTRRTESNDDVGPDRLLPQDGNYQNQPTFSDRPRIELDKDAVTQSQAPMRVQDLNQHAASSDLRQEMPLVANSQNLNQQATPGELRPETPVVTSVQDLGRQATPPGLRSVTPIVAPQASIVLPATTAETSITGLQAVSETSTPADLQHTAQNQSRFSLRVPSNQLASALTKDVLASALTNDNFSEVGEDLHTATIGRNARDAVRAAVPSAGAALKSQQQAELTQRLNGASLYINVNVNDESSSLRSGPNQTLVNGAHLANLDLTEGADNPFLNDGNRQQGANAAVDRGGRTPAGRPAEVPVGQANTQGEIAAFQQSLNTQAGAMGSPSTAALAGAAQKVQPILLDPLPANSTAAPNGPGQVLQTSRVNPTMATRPPLPQAPAEQVAVNITKAFGAGADKINIKLHPAALGRVEVKLEIAPDGHLTASISAERPETLELLQRDSRILERALQESGLRTSSDSLSFSLKSNGKNAATQSGENHDQSSGRDDELTEDENDSEFGADEGSLNNYNAKNRQSRSSGGINIVV